MNQDEIRKLLKLAARAMGFELLPCTCKVEPCRSDNGRHWRPERDSGDCAEMCAALEIGTQWVGAWVECSHGELFVTEEFGNDRSAAWRLAALRVAAEIGKGIAQ